MYINATLSFSINLLILGYLGGTKFGTSLYKNFNSVQEFGTSLYKIQSLVHHNIKILYIITSLMLGYIYKTR